MEVVETGESSRLNGTGALLTRAKARRGKVEDEEGARVGSWLDVQDFKKRASTTAWERQRQRSSPIYACLVSSCHVHWGQARTPWPERMATGNIARRVYFGAYRERTCLPWPAVVAAPSSAVPFPSRLRCWSRKAATPHWLREGAKCCCLDFRPPWAPPHPCRRPISRTSDLRVPGLVGPHVTLSDRPPEAYPAAGPCQL